MGFERVICSHFNYCGRSVDQAPTLSLRGPAQFKHEARSAELEVEFKVTRSEITFSERITAFCTKIRSGGKGIF